MPTRVLVIDDDIAMTEMLRLILEPNAFEVIVSHSGPEGISAAHNAEPEVIILDLAMPDMDGWEVCKEVRSFSQVPILVLSAISNPSMVAKALDEGADDFLLKPMTSSVLIAHLKRLVWRSRGGESSKKTPPDKKGGEKGSGIHRNTEPRRGGGTFDALHAAKSPSHLEDTRPRATSHSKRPIKENTRKKDTTLK